MQNRSLIHLGHHHLRSVFAYWLAHRYSFLFYTLFLTLIAAPLLAAFGLVQTHLMIFVGINLVAALVGIRRRHFSHVLLILLFALISIRIVAGSIELQSVIAASTIALVILGFIAGIDTVRVAMSSSRVSAELIYAGLSVYMLVGILFAILHWAVGLEWHDAYLLPEGGSLSLHTSMYFSFVTQTTLGLGDVLPKSDLARGLVMVQAVAGQLYLAVMVARLVSLYVSSAEKNNEGSST
ncbi:potassium channel family protein [Propionivibrio sp.]|uniref:potassium channel family protein n=1 Tax=Propionivibrio sp. TaxID=2212460 RepID=UPI003BF3030E